MVAAEAAFPHAQTEAAGGGCPGQQWGLCWTAPARVGGRRAGPAEPGAECRAEPAGPGAADSCCSCVAFSSLNGSGTAFPFQRKMRR